VIYPANSCVKPARPIRSVLTVGVEEDYTIPSVTFFTSEDLSGEAFLTTRGILDITSPFLSLVAINTNQIELFKERDYLGESFCLEMNPRYCKGEGSMRTCLMWDWGYVDLPWHGTLSISARLGCGNCAQTYVLGANAPNDTSPEISPRAREAKV